MIHIIPVYQSKGRLTFDNGIRSCRQGDPRRHPLAMLVLSHIEPRLCDDGKVILYRVSLMEGITVDGLVNAARGRMWKLRIAPACLNETLHGWSTVGQIRWLRRANRGDKAQ